MIPEIEFRYSEVYNNMYHENYTKKDEEKWGKYPSSKKIHSMLKNREKVWNKHGKKILNEIEKISGFKWKEKKIICYIVGKTLPFSDPLTMSLENNNIEFIDTLTHELIHQVQIQNEDKFNKAWKGYIVKNFKKENYNCKTHIFLHAIHKEIFLKLFEEKRLEKEIELSKKFPVGYYRSWQIVNKKGHENIIKDFKKEFK